MAVKIMYLLCSVLLLAVSLSPSCASDGAGAASELQLQPSQLWLASSVQELVSEATYNNIFLHRDDPACPASRFYSYNAFVQATQAFPEFGTTGTPETQKRELAAFFGQTSHETTGGSDNAPDGPYTWGYCFIEEIDQSYDYCDPNNAQYPCVPGRKYFGRGPIQLTWNFNYGPVGQYFGFDGLGDPGLLSRDPVLAFKAALWFWMNPQPPKPSAHDVITGRYQASGADVAANRVPGYGYLTYIINGGECGPASNPGGYSNAAQANRIGFYLRYSQILGIDAGQNLDCSTFY